MSTGDDTTRSPSFFLGIVQKITMTKTGSWIYGRVVPPIDRVLMVKTKGKMSLSPGDTGGTGGLALLTTTGREERQAAPHPARIRTRRRRHRHHRLERRARAQPVVVLQHQGQPRVKLTLRGGHQGDYRAEEVPQGEERERLWKVACEMYPGFADYQTRADRLIPLIHCTPVVK